MTMPSIMWAKGIDNARPGYAEEIREEESLIAILLPGFILFLGLCCTTPLYFHPKFMLSIE